MLIDGTHSEETRVVITSGNRLEEYDVETSTKSQLRGNIYLAKITRVEPSLQAAFVDFGGNRHGFLAFNEIHPDYYQIPIEDREKLKREVAEMDDSGEAAQAHIDAIDGDVEHVEHMEHAEHMDAAAGEEQTGGPDRDGDRPEAEPSAPDFAPAEGGTVDPVSAADDAEAEPHAEAGEDADGERKPEDSASEEDGEEPDADRNRGNRRKTAGNRGRQRRDNPMRRYRIQEVIKRRQILLVQVVKEERGNKGAALTTYLSLAGRYCVLMPNTVRGGGGISRKITSATDRRRLRDLVKGLNVPEGMGVIMRTAGMERNKAEIKRDFDYLMRVWEDVRELTLKSAAPTLVYEEGNLIKRAIRDLYTREIEEVLVEGQEAYQVAKKLMRLMMPSHAKRVQPYRDPTIPLFHRYQVETQLEAMHSPVVQLKSGGYVVINPTEALVSIDVNSGRATKERNIEETATKTNLEAATEIARQLRMRDLAGLIVIDFIDMDESRNQRAVERRFKEAVKPDRARIQLGRISTFGLFEMSRQRMRPSLMETSTEMCPHCQGSGYVRSIESTSIRVLRSIEEEGIRNRSSEVTVSVATPIALYILNQKRDALINIEERYALKVTVQGDDSLVPPDMELERTRVRAETGEETAAIRDQRTIVEVEDEDDSEDEPDAEEAKEKDGGGRKRRPRRRRRKDSETTVEASEAEQPEEAPEADISAETETEAAHEDGAERAPRRRRRGRRGGRRRGPRSEKTAAVGVGEEGAPAPGADESEAFEPAEAETATPEPAEVEAAAPEPTEGDLTEREVMPEAEPMAEPKSEPEPEPEPERVPVAAALEHADAPAFPGQENSKAPDEDGAQPGKGTENPAAPAVSRRGWWQRVLD